MSARLIVILICALLFGSAAWRWWLAQLARAWPSVIGKVTTARIVRGATLDDSNDRTRRTEYFDIDVRYEYAVGGKSHVSTTYSFRTDRLSPRSRWL